MMKFENVNQLVNSLARIFSHAQKDFSATVKHTLNATADLIAKRPKETMSGDYNIIGKFSLHNISGDCLVLRCDPQPWIVGLLIFSTQNHIFFYASLDKIVMYCGDSHLSISRTKTQNEEFVGASRAAYRNALEKVSGGLDESVAKPTSEIFFVLSSERIYDMLQTLLYAESRFGPAGLDAGIKLSYVSVIDKSFVTADDLGRIGLRDALNLRASEVPEFRRQNRASFIESLDWHLARDSLADIPSISDLFSRLYPQDASNVIEKNAIFLSLDLEKRVWIEQRAVLGSAIRKLKKCFNISTIYINGMTAPAKLDDCEDFFGEIKRLEEAFILDLCSEISGVDFVHLHGCSLGTKVSAARHCHYFISPLGSAALIPMCNGVPGISYGTESFVKTGVQLLPPSSAQVLLIPTENVRAIHDDLSAMKYKWSTNTPQGTSYSIDEAYFLRILDSHLCSVIGG
ncbi:hypothetical protein [Falsiroseomonas sp. E2-1-a20]|uniref:hypothetical protein n=1 Tax=Falsiroseomonas sp. E2-1-a20 TaxID=3239300 RepID=UPI003F2B3571